MMKKNSSYLCFFSLLWILETITYRRNMQAVPTFHSIDLRGLIPDFGYEPVELDEVLPSLDAGNKALRIFCRTFEDLVILQKIAEKALSSYCWTISSEMRKNLDDPKVPALIARIKKGCTLKSATEFLDQLKAGKAFVRSHEMNIVSAKPLIQRSLSLGAKIEERKGA